MADKLKIEFPTQGWEQFLTYRREILDAYDQAKQKARSNKVRTEHGRVAEAQVRGWLASFLPKRYGVTPGYVVSPGLSNDQETPHYDVIIYDVQNSPVLWIENNLDHSEQGRSRALPAEHVQCVLEVKSNFSSSTAAAAIKHLKELSPLLSGTDDPGERYKLHLPPGFICGLIFVELGKKNEFSAAALSKIVDAVVLRGFMGGLILRGEGHDKPVTGRLEILRSMTPLAMEGKHSLIWNGNSSRSKSIKFADDLYLSAMLVWMQTNFSQFGFDLIARLQGTYERGMVSSWYGLGW